MTGSWLREVVTLIELLARSSLWILVGLTCAAGFATGLLFALPMIGTDVDRSLIPWMALATGGLFCLSVAKALHSRATRRALRFSLRHQGSWWLLVQQPDGRSTTQLHLELDVVNHAAEPIKLSEVRLLKWWEKARVDAHFHLPAPRSRYHSSAHPAVPGDTTTALIDMFVDRALGGAGRPIFVSLAIRDQNGEVYKLRWLKVNSHDHMP